MTPCVNCISWNIPSHLNRYSLAFFHHHVSKDAQRNHLYTKDANIGINFQYKMKTLFGNNDAEDRPDKDRIKERYVFITVTGNCKSQSSLFKEREIIFVFFNWHGFWKHQDPSQLDQSLEAPLEFHQAHAWTCPWSSRRSSCFSPSLRQDTFRQTTTFKQ